MLVTIGEGVIAVKFQHAQTEEMKGTKCLIIKGKESDNPEGFISAGYSKVHPKDNFCKEKGRRVALKKALAESSFTKAQRAIFWEEYRTWGANPRW